MDEQEMIKKIILVVFLIFLAVFILYIYGGILEANPQMKGLKHTSSCMVYDPSKEKLEKQHNIKIEKLRIYSCEDRSGIAPGGHHYSMKSCCVSYEYKELP